MAKANKVASIVRGYARQVIKEALEQDIAPAEFLEESWLLWTTFGQGYEALVERMPKEAIDFENVFRHAKPDWTDHLVDMIHESLDGLVRASQQETAPVPGFTGNRGK